MNKVFSPWTSSSALGRWGLMGPYYAMFPVSFVRKMLAFLADEGDSVIDPFCGRGTVPFVAASMGLGSLGIDLNPVGWVFSSVKVDPEPDKQKVLDRAAELASLVVEDDKKAENEFQEWAWAPEVLGFLRIARRELRWKDDRTDRTLMAIILVHLHGKLGNAVSNQLRQSKAMGPEYAVRWWTARNMRPPQLDPLEYFSAKIEWRYAKGIPPLTSRAHIHFGDARDHDGNGSNQKHRILFTSPPYAGVTNYRVDHWIRLWLLGDGALPNWESSQRYGAKEPYRRMIHHVFNTAAKQMTGEGRDVILVRTDSRTFTRDVTAATLRAIWPDHLLLSRAEGHERSQTRLFGDTSDKPGETDFLLLPVGHRRPTGFRRVPESAMRSVSVADLSDSCPILEAAE